MHNIVGGNLNNANVSTHTFKIAFQLGSKYFKISAQRHDSRMEVFIRGLHQLNKLLHE